MFLKKIKVHFGGLSYRLAMTYLLFFIPCYLITFGVFYVWTSDFLENRDRDLIESRINQYQEIVDKEGVAGLQGIYADSKMHVGAAKYLLQLCDLQGNVLFFHMSEGLEQEFVDIEKQLEQGTNSEHGSWFFVESTDHDEDAIEVKSVIINHKWRLNVGASTEDRDELLEKFQAMFLTILMPLLISSFLLSIFLAKKFLRPINNLSSLIKEVKGGGLSKRALLPESKDELYELTLAFNDMLTQIEYLIEAMKDTLDNVAHDLKTPLARARLASEMALQSNSEEQLKLAAEESVENLDIILKMIQTIMTMSGLNSKTFSLKKEKFPAIRAIEDVVDLYFFVAEEKQIAIKIDCSKDLEVYADQMMIRQALANLLDNAIKYSPEKTEINIAAFKEGNMVHFRLNDQGPGIAPEDIPRIWERLYRGDKSRHEQGFGLGLSLVKIFIESNGGEVFVESTQGRGAHFEFTTPAFL